MINRTMIRLCWVFVLLAVVFPLSDARPHNCEQRERSLANLDEVEDSLNKAKQLYPNCEDDNESSNSSECSKKDKSLGFIDVALDLVSIAKKNILICPHLPTMEPLTSEKPTPKVTTEEPTPTPNASTEEPTPEVTTEAGPPKDCQELQASGVKTSGVYTVWLQGKPVEVRCDMYTDGGGWTVIQLRGKFEWEVNFDREWIEYKNGFGILLHGEFWWGNDNIFALTNQGNYTLRMDMTAADGDKAYALFREFRIDDEKANYTLHVGGYKGTSGFLGYRCMINSDGSTFSTKDRNTNINVTKNCGEKFKGGFWYNDPTYCAWCNPNGLYKPGVEAEIYMHYYDFKKNVGLSSIDMKLKRL